jgi:hypothetical protein
VTGRSTSAALPVGTATGSPAPSRSPSVAPSSGSGDRSALVGLCNAYAHGGIPTHSAGYRKLVAAAGGADRIAAYCDALTSPTGATPGATPGAGRGSRRRSG